MSFTPVNETVAVRQTSSASLAGIICSKSGKAYEQGINTVTGVIEYADPDDRSINSADQGGEYIFSESVEIKEIRGACGNITLVVCDLDDSHSVVITTSPSPIVTHAFMNNLVVQKSQKLKITSSTAGWVEVYVVKSIYN